MDHAIDFLGLIVGPAEVTVFLTVGRLKCAVAKGQQTIEHRAAVFVPSEDFEGPVIKRAARGPRALGNLEVGDVLVHDRHRYRASAERGEGDGGDLNDLRHCDLRPLNTNNGKLLPGDTTARRPQKQKESAIPLF